MLRDKYLRPVFVICGRSTERLAAHQEFIGPHNRVLLPAYYSNASMDGSVGSGTSEGSSLE